MAEAPADLSTGDNLEEKILQVLSDAGGPVKIAQLVKKCQVPKKTLNQVLYRLKKEAKVSSEAPATWSLGGDAPGDGAPEIPEDPTAQPSLDDRILRFLEASGPHKALHIAKALGMRTAKQVNPHLYAMRNSHRLSYDGQTWKIYDSSQEGRELGPRSPHHLHLPMPEDPSARGIPTGACGSQHIYLEKSMLRRVQLGHCNEMSLPRDAAEHPAYSFSGSPPDVSSKATPSRSSTHNPSSSMLITAELRAITLEDSCPQTTEPVLREDGAPDTGSCVRPESSETVGP